MHIDIPTVSLITALVACLEGAILAALWVVHPNIRGVAFWALGALAIATGTLGIVLRDILPLPVSIIGSNLLILSGFIATWWGLETFFDRRIPYRAGLAILLVGAAMLVQYGLIDSNSRLRIALLLILLALLSGLRIYSLLREIRPSTQFSQVLCATVFGCQTVLDLALSAALFMSPPAERPLAQMPLAGLVFLLLMLLSIAAVFSAVLLVNQTIAGRLQEAARRDALTDALTRRALDEAAEIEIVRSLRHDMPLSLLLLDIDHFKTINDRFGHPAGDAVLRQFTVTTRRCLRREDLLSRIGGEEFCALLPNTGAAGAAQLAERIRAAIADLQIDIDGQHPGLRVSIGVATLRNDGTEWPELMRRADDALYAAKRSGRNRVAIAGRDTPALAPVSYSAGPANSYSPAPTP